MKQFVFLLVVFSLPNSVSAESVLHILLIGDTNDGAIGRSVEIDLRAMRGYFEDAFPKQRLSIHTIKGRDTNPKYILNFASRIKTNADDAVLCYYSGHGGYNSKIPRRPNELSCRWNGRKHFFDLQNRKKLYRSELLDSFIKRKSKPRLTVLITDCCNVKNDFGEPMASPSMMTPPENPIIQKLFFEHRGWVDINSSRPDQASVGDSVTGGLFTSHLLSLFREYEISGASGGKFVAPDWPTLFYDVRKHTNTSYENYVKLVGRHRVAQHTQIPYMFSTFGDKLTKGQKCINGTRFGVAINDRGMVVLVVDNSPAKRLGLTQGDQILKINGKTVANNASLTKRVYNSPQNASLDFIRNGNRLNTRFQLAY